MSTEPIFIGSYALLWLLVLSILVILQQLLKHSKPNTGVLQQKDKGLPAGEPFPLEALESVAGRQVTFRQSSPRESDTIVLFTDSNCAPCNALYPHLNAVRKKNKAVRIVVLVMGDKSAAAEKAIAHSLDADVCSIDPMILMKCQINVFPFSYCVSSEGMVLAKGLTSMPEHFTLLLQEGRKNRQAAKPDIPRTQGLKLS